MNEELQSASGELQTAPQGRDVGEPALPLCRSARGRVEMAVGRLSAAGMPDVVASRLAWGWAPRLRSGWVLSRVVRPGAAGRRVERVVVVAIREVIAASTARSTWVGPGVWVAGLHPGCRAASGPRRPESPGAIRGACGSGRLAPGLVVAVGGGDGEWLGGVPGRGRRVVALSLCGFEQALCDSG
jgi:hypothetical protein